MAEEFVTVAKTSDIPEGEARVVDLGGARLALCQVEGKFYAIDDTCTHDNGPLGAGTLDGHAIICPRHGAKFDVRDGRVLQMPAAFPVRAYNTRVVGDEIQVDIESGD
ncbi:MAG: non-heme iron oxygenase ferredoxin subunit [Candidatus Zixiibacteriota bacterium]